MLGFGTRPISRWLQKNSLGDVWRRGHQFGAIVVLNEDSDYYTLDIGAGIIGRSVFYLNREGGSVCYICYWTGDGENDSILFERLIVDALGEGEIKMEKKKRIRTWRFEEPIKGAVSAELSEEKKGFTYCLNSR